MNTRWIDRIIYGGALRQIAVLIVLTASLILISSIAVCWGSEYQMTPEEKAAERNGQQPDDDSWTTSLWSVYNNFVDPGNQANVNREDRLWAIAVSLLGSVVLGGLLISTISNIMERRVEECRNGLVHYKLSGHIVIIGADAMLACLVRQLCKKKDNRTLLIQTSKDVSEARLSLFAKLTKEEERRIVWIHAARNSKEELERLYIANAKEVFILGDSGELDDVEYYHDSMNVDCLNLIGKICQEKERKTPLRCNVLFEYQSTFSVFQFTDIDDDIKRHIDFCPFNFYETWAQKIFVGNKCTGRDITYLPLDYEPIDYHSEKHVHLVVVGMSRMGVALAVEAAHIAHYPNFIRNKKKKTRITFIDCNARKEMEHFKQAYANLFDVSYSSFIDPRTGIKEQETPNNKYTHLGTDFIDIDWQFVQGEIESPGVRRLLTEWSEEPDSLMTLAICLNLTHHSISSAIYLPHCIYEKEIPVLVQQRITSAIVEKLFRHSSHDKEKQSKTRYRNLRPFGMLDDCLDLQIADDLCAKRVNVVYKEGKEFLATLPPQETIDEWWRELKTVKRWSNIYYANSIPTKLRSVGYKTNEKKLTEEQVALLAEVEHNRWNIEELLLGYRPVYQNEQEAIRRNPKLKEVKRNNEYVHVDIRPYRELDAETQKYDIILTRHLPLIMKGSRESEEA